MILRLLRVIVFINALDVATLWRWYEAKLAEELVPQAEERKLLRWTMRNSEKHTETQNRVYVALGGFNRRSWRAK